MRPAALALLAITPFLPTTTTALPQLVVFPSPTLACLNDVLGLNAAVAKENPSAAINSISTEAPKSCRDAGFEKKLQLPYEPQDLFKLLPEVAKGITDATKGGR
ncbi:hypothetical protein ACHAQA_002881 [Verticillium albo-atrum]